MHKSLVYIIALAGLCFSLPDTTGNAFFPRLENQLQADYAACTGDSTKVPIKTLITWKHLIDSMAAMPEYSAIAKEYRKETGNSPVKDGPCKVLHWKLRVDPLTSGQPGVQQKTGVPPTDSPAVRNKISNPELKQR